MSPTETSNGKVEFIKKQIGDAIRKVEQGSGIQDHEELAEISVLSIRVGEMVFDEMVGLKTTLNTFVEQRQFTHKLIRLAAGLLGTSGVMGTIFLALQIIDKVSK